MSQMEARGYGKTHYSIRKGWKARVEAGEVPCARCSILIAPPGEPCPRCGRETKDGKNGRCGWDLGHDDYDRDIYVGPEHTCCNRRAGARNAAHKTNRQKRVWSREWLNSP